MRKASKHVARKRGQIVPRGENKYLVRLFVGRDQQGRRKYVSRMVEGTRKAAERELTRSLREVDTGTFVEPSKQTLREYLCAWLDTQVRLKVSPRTHEDYKSRIVRDVLPTIGERRLDQVALQDVQRVYGIMSEKRLSARTIRYTHAILKQALEQAVRTGLLVRNPAQYAVLPRHVRKEMSVLSAEQVKRFLELTRGTDWNALWAVLILGGLRPGEALGLRWADIDGTRVRVVRALKKGAGETYYLAEPKTERSRRTVVLPTDVVSALQEHKFRQAKHILSAGASFQRSDLVFPNHAGRPMDISKIRRLFKAALKAANLPEIRLYDSRHTHATLMLSAGVNPKVVSERLGHTNIGITLEIYSHVLPDMQQASVERLEGMLRAAQ